MVYKSPFLILASFNISEDDVYETPLRDLKKRLLLELQLSGSDFITTSSGTYSKNDLLALFEDLEKDDNLIHHRMVYVNKDLYRFISEHRFASAEKMALPELMADQDFAVFIAPYLTSVVKRLLKRFFTKHHYDACCTLVNITRYIPPALRPGAFDLLAGSLRTMHTDLQAVIDKNKKFTRQEYLFLLNPDLIRLLNHLPEEFDSQRHSLAYRVNDLANLIYESHDRFTIRLFEVWQYIICPPALEKTLQHNLGYMNSNQGKQMFFGAIIFIGGTLLLFFFVQFVLILFFKPDGEVYKMEQRRHLTDHLVYTEGLAGRTARDTTDISIASGDQIPARPFSQSYGNNVSDQTEDLIPMIISNRSQHDMVIFRIDDNDRNAATVPADSVSHLLIGTNDLINFYVGLQWNEYADYPKTAGDYPLWINNLSYGRFTYQNDAHRKLLKTFFKYQGESVSHFNIDDIGLYANYKPSLRYRKILDHNEQLFAPQNDSLVIDSLKVTIFGISSDTLINWQPFYHYRN